MKKKLKPMQNVFLSGLISGLVIAGFQSRASIPKKAVVEPKGEPINLSATLKEGPRLLGQSIEKKRSTLVFDMGLVDPIQPKLYAFNDFFFSDAPQEQVSKVEAANFKPTAGTTYQFQEDHIIDLKSFGRFMRDIRVAPALPNAYAQGIQIRYNHADFKDFRKEYQFNYENGAPKGMDNNVETGFSSIKDEAGGREGNFWRLKTKDNSIRMTSPAFRFRPVDFKNFSLRLKVLKGIAGADAAKDGDGEDDSVFQLWLSLRKIKPGMDRSTFDNSDDIKVFGYYWGDTNKKGKTPEPGTLVENSSSNKSYLIFSMPETWQVFLNGGTAQEGKWHEFHRNLADDIKRAWPTVNPEEWEVVALTVQSDSNSTESEGEAVFDRMSFDP